MTPFGVAKCNFGAARKLACQIRYKSNLLNSSPQRGLEKSDELGEVTNYANR